MPENVSQNAQKWLIVILIYADFTDTIHIANDADIRIGLNSMFKDVLDTTINPELCRLFVVMDTIFKEDGKPDVTNLVAKYEVCNLGDEKRNKISNCVVFHQGALTPGENRNAGTGFNRHLLQQSDSLHHILKSIEIIPDKEEVLFITWDHGSGFGIFRDEFDDTIQAMHRPLGTLNELPDLAAFLHLENATLQDMPTGLKDNSQGSGIPELLSNAELASAFDKWLNPVKAGPQKKIGVLLMMNCWMMNIHTMYAMKNTVQCLVAAQSDMSNPGYNYESIIKLINQPGKDKITDQRLAIHCRESCRAIELESKAEKMGLKPINTIKSWVIVAIDLQTLDNVFASFKKLTELLLATVRVNDAVKYLLRYIRPAMYDFTSDKVHMIDCYNFFTKLLQINGALRDENIKSYVLPPELAQSMSDFTESIRLGQMLLGDYSLDVQYVVTGTKGDYIVSKPSGFSLFFRRWPYSLFNEKVQHNVNNDPLLTDTPQWGDLLTILFG